MNVTDSETRRNKILELVVEAYVTAAIPVGSQWIAKKLRSALSPATIRHIMSELESAGYLEQPHTSAGRIPTDQGYRLYVDVVMEHSRLLPEEVSHLKSLIEPEEQDIKQLLTRAGGALAGLGHQAAFVITPTVKRSRVKQVEIVPISMRRVLCVLIARDEILASHVVQIEEPLNRDEAGSLVRFINAELEGLPFDDLLGALKRRLLAETDSLYYLVRQSLSILQQALSTEPNEYLFVEGTSYVVSQPEFCRNPQIAQELLRLIESPGDLLESVRSSLLDSGVQVRIGKEVKLDGFDVCSTMTAPVVISDEVIGGIGVLGPKRMDYPRLWALVGGTASAINDVLTKWGRSK